MFILILSMEIMINVNHAGSNRNDNLFLTLSRVKSLFNLGLLFVQSVVIEISAHKLVVILHIHLVVV